MNRLEEEATLILLMSHQRWGGRGVFWKASVPKVLTWVCRGKETHQVVCIYQYFHGTLS